MLSAIANPQLAAMAAPGWQFVFLSLAIVVLLLEIIHGWRLGLVRQLVRVVAIVVAYSCAFFAGRTMVPLMHSFFNLPDPILAVLGGAILAALLFAAINLIGAFLFKRTAQQESRFVRLIWGSTGAFLGILLGLFTIWLGFAGIRMVGSVAEARLRTQNLPASSTAKPNGPAQIQSESAASPSPNPLMAMLAEMKSSLESGRVGEAVRTIDPLPPALYRVLEKAGEVASNVQSAERFLSFPGAREISEHPKVVALRNDPRVLELIATGHLFELMKNQRMIEAMNDPALQARVRKFELEQALDYALKRN